MRALEVDHIVPRSQGGSNDLSNLQALCSLCNVQKLDRDQTDLLLVAAGGHEGARPERSTMSSLSKATCPPYCSSAEPMYAVDECGPAQRADCSARIGLS